jgi:hypothetical protein
MHSLRAKMSHFFHVWYLSRRRNSRVLQPTHFLNHVISAGRFSNDLGQIDGPAKLRVEKLALPWQGTSLGVRNHLKGFPRFDLTILKSDVERDMRYEKRREHNGPTRNK